MKEQSTTPGCEEAAVRLARFILMSHQSGDRYESDAMLTIAKALIARSESVRSITPTLDAMATPITDAHLAHLNLPDGRKVGIPTETVALLRQLERDYNCIAASVAPSAERQTITVTQDAERLERWRTGLIYRLRMLAKATPYMSAPSLIDEAIEAANYLEEVGPAVAQSATGAFVPTHSHADGGLYRFVANAKYKTAADDAVWSDAIIYESKDRRMYVTTPARWHDRFKNIDTADRSAKG